MTSTAPSPLRSAPAVAAPGLACLAEIESWLVEVAPVVAALRQAPAVPSPGQRRWLVRLTEDAVQALSLLHEAEDEALAHDEPTDGIEWLQTRVGAALDGARQLLAAQPATPAAA